ncbi:MAG: hypothetical protein Q8920_00340 [Bacillota bacterium]|nr:hypothetical protein [Bacillota bacterium]
MAIEILSLSTNKISSGEMDNVKNSIAALNGIVSINEIPELRKVVVEYDSEIISDILLKDIIDDYK